MQQASLACSQLTRLTQMVMYDKAICKLSTKACMLLEVICCTAARSLMLVDTVQVLENEICFKWSEYENIFELFHARASMHRRVYTHRYSLAV